LLFITSIIALTIVDAITPRGVALFGLSLLLSPLIALYSLTYQLVLRDQKFGVLATRGPLQNSAIGLNQWIFNHSSLQSVGLVLGEILGRLIGLLFLFFNIRAILKERQYKVLRGSFREKLDRPVLVNLISIGFDLVAASALLIFINSSFGDWAAGQLSMAQKIVVLPIVFFGTNLAQYFLSTGSHERRNGINMSRNDFDSIIWKLLCFGIFIALTLLLTSTSLLSIFLGSEWTTSGKLIKILLPIMVISLVWNPMSSFYYVRGLWVEFLKVSAIRLGFIFAGASAANLFNLNLYESIVLITLSSGVIQLYGLHVLRKNF
jgi:O-antigen/teichoic acid export membrane protein